MHTCMHVCMYVFCHVCMYALMHVCLCACMHVCIFTLEITRGSFRSPTKPLVASAGIAKRNQCCQLLVMFTTSFERIFDSRIYRMSMDFHQTFDRIPIGCRSNYDRISILFRLKFILIPIDINWNLHGITIMLP